MQHIIRLEIKEENIVDEDNLTFPAPAALGEILQFANYRGKESERIKLIIGDLTFEFILKPHQYQVHTVGNQGKLSIILPPVSAEAVMHIRKLIPEKFELQDLIKGENSEIVVTAIKEIVGAGKSIAVIGEFGAGTGTLVDSLTQMIPVGKEVVLIDELATWQDAWDMAAYSEAAEKQVLVTHHAKSGADFHKSVKEYLEACAAKVLYEYMPNACIPYVIELTRMKTGQRVIRKMSRWELNGTELIEKEIFHYDEAKNEYSF